MTQPLTNSAAVIRIRFRSLLSSGNSPIGKNTLWMLSGQGARLLIQAVYFVLMARNLGPQQYGAFVAVTAAAAIASPFVGNGMGSLLIKNVARNRTLLPEYLGNAMLMMFLSGFALFGIVGVGCLLILPKSIPPRIIVELVLSDVLLYRFVDLAGYVFQSVEMLRWTAYLNVFSSFTRLAGIAAIVALHRPTLAAWSIAYLSTTILAVLVSLFAVLWYFGAPKLALGRIRGELREGFYFSTGLSAQTIYNDIDKTMLARLGSLDATGIYAAAYRLIDVAFIPIRSLLAAAYPSFFRSGQQGITSSLRFAERLLPKALLYSSVISVGLIIAAPLFPRIIGAEYARTSEALRWLALLPLLKTCHYFVADSLTGAGYQGLRTFVQVFVALLNIGLNLWIIPMYSWRGAAWSSLASDGFLALLLFTCVTILRSRKESVLGSAQVA